MENGMLWAAVPALMWGGVLSWYDCKERRLPNWLTIGGAAVALTWRLGYGGVPSLREGFVAALIGGIFLLVPFLMRGAGGGDVKMLFAAGAIVGLGEYRVLVMIVVTSIAGVVFGISMLVAGKLDGARLKHFAILAGLTVVLLAAAVVLFEQRDLRQTG